MTESTPPRRKRFPLYAALSTVVAALTESGIALAAGVTPAMAADLASQADTQVAVFMVPLTLLVLAVLFEVARTVLRGPMPAEAPARRPARRHWARDGRR